MAQLDTVRFPSGSQTFFLSCARDMMNLSQVHVSTVSDSPITVVAQDIFCRYKQPELTAIDIEEIAFFVVAAITWKINFLQQLAD